MLSRLAPYVALATSLLALFSQRVAGDADFESVYELLRKDHSGKGGDSGKKYFRPSPPLHHGLVARQTY
jgi:hypothetical protein